MYLQQQIIILNSMYKKIRQQCLLNFLGHISCEDAQYYEKIEMNCSLLLTEFCCYFEKNMSDSTKTNFDMSEEERDGGIFSKTYRLPEDGVIYKGYQSKESTVTVFKRTDLYCYLRQFSKENRHEEDVDFDKLSVLFDEIMKILVLDEQPRQMQLKVCKLFKEHNIEFVF